MGHRQSGDMVVARQQQAALQTALGSWVAAQSSLGGGLAAARSFYATNSGSKLSLLQDYLQPATYAALEGDGSKVTSRALTASGASLQFSDWAVGGSPSIIWNNFP